MARVRTETRSDLEAMARGLLRAEPPEAPGPGAAFYIDNLRYVLGGLLDSARIDRDVLIAFLESPDGVREVSDGSDVDVLADRILAL